MDRFDVLIEAVYNIALAARQYGTNGLNDPEVRAALKAEVQEALSPTPGKKTIKFNPKTEKVVSFCQGDLFARERLDLGGGQAIGQTLTLGSLVEKAPVLVGPDVPSDEELP